MDHLKKNKEQMEYVLKNYLIFILLFTSCNLITGNSENQNRYDIAKFNTWYYPDGTLKKVQEFSKASKQDGKYLFFYPNGVLEDSAIIIKGEFQGDRTEYFENGSVKAVTTYLNDKYRNGYDFYDNGKLQYFKSYNYDTNLMYIIEYDLLGGVIRKEGNLIYSFIIEDHYKANSELEFELLVPTPPDCFSIVEVFEKTHKKSSLKLVSTIEPDKYNRVKYSTYFDSSNAVLIEYHAKIIENNIIIDRDTLTYLINKKGEAEFFRGTHDFETKSYGDPINKFKVDSSSDVLKGNRTVSSYLNK